VRSRPRMCGIRAPVPTSKRAFQGHFAPRQAHRVLAHGTAEPHRQRAAHPACVGCPQDTCRRSARRPLARAARSIWLAHFVVLPSVVASRARGTAIAVSPNVPIKGLKHSLLDDRNLADDRLGIFGRRASRHDRHRGCVGQLSFGLQPFAEIGDVESHDRS
jgi:hypothetical protein